ncbi:MAG: hypothetical protein OEM28_11655 [Nitrosopumilus sp.]|nr:hypothetical protein [Nitrosopumilus sp.]MDH3488477.1 hypothetical protein [Nitrosopumilus sp.]
MFKFQSPRKTKSGESVITLWNEIKENWRIYKRAKLEDDFSKMRDAASRIIELQDDLGIKQAEFPELKKEKAGIQ